MQQNGLNTEKVKHAYISIVVLSVIFIIASYLILHNHSSNQVENARATTFGNEQVFLYQNAISALLDFRKFEPKTVSPSTKEELRKVLSQLKSIAQQPSIASNTEILKINHLFTTKIEKILDQKSPEKLAEHLHNALVLAKSSADQTRTITKKFEERQYSLTLESNTIHLTILALFIVLLAFQAKVIFYPGYLELKRNAQKVQKTKRELNYAATHDPITDLLNRKEGEKILNWAMSNAPEKNKMVGLFHIDLDDFKNINEKMGHATGDNLLHQTAQRLRRTFRKTDTVARMGGDEFLVIIPNLDCEETLTNLAEKLLDVFQVPFQLISDKPSHVTSSIGMACFPDDARNSQELMVAADMALRKAKESGKNCYARFNNTMKSDFNKKMAICDRINTALENKEFEVFYHPQVHIESGAVTGIEALVRWRDPELGLRSPGSFIDTVEASGYMGKLGAYILDQAIHDAHYWHENKINFGRMALNMSAVQLNDIDLVNQLLDSLMKYKLPPHYLSIEILENVVMTGQEHRFKQLIDELNDLDIHVELDDFGTGHASLYNLKQFAINRIKLDCDFISDIETNNRQRSIVEGLVKIINNIGLEIIAEGVETPTQAQMLQDWGCLHAQGFLYTKPLPFEEMTSYLKCANYKRSLPAVTSPEQTQEDDITLEKVGS